MRLVLCMPNFMTTLNFISYLCKAMSEIVFELVKSVFRQPKMFISLKIHRNRCGRYSIFLYIHYSLIWFKFATHRNHLFSAFSAVIGLLCIILVLVVVIRRCRRSRNEAQKNLQNHNQQSSAPSISNS